MLKINGHPINLIQQNGQWQAIPEDIPGISANAGTAIKAIELLKKMIDGYDEIQAKNKLLKATSNQHAKGFLRKNIRKRWDG
jgi:hypothetical protein